MRLAVQPNVGTPKEGIMPIVAGFYSVNEGKKPPQERVYHDNSACPLGRDIPPHERHTGTRDYRLCDDCRNLDIRGR